MPDTARTLAALQALLADNVTGDINPQDVRDFLVSTLGEYAQIYVHDGAAAQSFTTAPSKMTGFTTNGPAGGNMTADAANDKIIIGTDGDYKVDFQISFSGAVNEMFEFHARVNGVEQVNGALKRKLSAGGDEGSASFTCILSGLSTADDIEIYGESGNAGGANATPIHSQLVVTRVK